MSPTRAPALDLARLLNAAAGPIYALDDERRIVFCNEAAAAWAGLDVSQLVGQTCGFHSDPSLDGPAAIAAALCPPPEVFHGQRVTGRLTVSTSDASLKSRTAEFIPLPGEADPCVAVLVVMAEQDSTVEAAIPDPSLDGEAAVLHERIRRFRHELRDRNDLHRLVGNSPTMRQVRSQIQLAAASRAPVLIVGHAGSGRDHAARAIHYSAERKDSSPFVPLSCVALGTELLRSTIAAIAAKAEDRSPANTAPLEQGTLLLNDVEQSPADVQAELAALLSAGRRGPRVIATASEPLAQQVAQGTFREDLAFELATLTIQIPPLGQRLGDLPLVAQMLLEEINARGKKQLRGFSPEALDALAGYSWPGDVTELQQMVTEAHRRGEGFEITVADLPKRIHLSADALARPRRRDEPIHLERFLAEVETELIRRALSRAKGNKSRAAKLLGMTRPKLYRRMVQLGVSD